LISDIRDGTYAEAILENRVLRKIFAKKRDEITVVGENRILSSFINFTLRQT
jgi:hypothetical protein